MSIILTETDKSNISIHEYANKLYIDNTGTGSTTPLIYGEFNTCKLKINGRTFING